jgi:hypothetical protein
MDTDELRALSQKIKLLAVHIRNLAEHTHDISENYYSESEVDDLLALKAEADHNHDEDYSALEHNHDEDYSPIVHNHDATYYSESEVDDLLALRAEVDHDHDADYSPLEHNHDEEYSALGHDHDANYYLKTAVDSLLATKSDTTHTHPGSIPIAVASDNIRLENYTQRYTSAIESWIKAKEIEVHFDGEIRVSWEMHRSSACGTYTMHGRVYVNGIAVGYDWTTTSTSYASFSSDVAVAIGDLVQIYLWGGCGSNYNYVRNMRLKYDLDFPDNGTVQDP